MAVQVTMTITADDFDHIVETAMLWGKEWVKQQHRFEPTVSRFDWKMAYWVDTYLEVLFCQHYLSASGYESSTHFDTATASYLILTNYKWSEGEW